MTSTIKVYIALCENDLQFAIENTSKTDFIITDLHCPLHPGQTIVPHIPSEKEGNLSHLVSDWYKNIIHDNALPADMYGYVNNFYECSILPLISFLYAIDVVVKENLNCELVFNVPFKIIGSKPLGLNYYLAEHETVGVYLYDRHRVLLPYLCTYIIISGHIVHYQSQKNIIKQRAMNIIRTWGVLSRRFMKDISNDWVGQKKSMIEFFEPSILIIIRTVAQASALTPFLKNTSLKVGVLIVDSNTDSHAHMFLKENLPKTKNVKLIKGERVGFGFICSTYFRTAVLLFKSRKFVFNYKGINLGLGPAFAEIISMSANLRLYKAQLENSVTQLSTDKLKVIFSLEQKSPHAYMDFCLGEKISAPTFQLKQFTQSNRYLPAPIFSHGFICDLPEEKLKFEKCWPDQKHKLSYIGTFRGIMGPDVSLKESAKYTGEAKNICLFGGALSSVNLETIRALVDAGIGGYPNTLTVKLHPRDNYDYRKIFPTVVFVTTQGVSFEQFCNQFNVIITYPSSVIGELLFTPTPFIIFKPSHSVYLESSSSIEYEGIPVVYNIDDIKNVLEDFTRLVVLYTQSQKTFLQNKKLIVDIETIDEHICELTNGLLGE